MSSLCVVLRKRGAAAVKQAVHLEQEHVLGAVAAMDGELARALLGGDHMQLRRECGNRHHRLSRYVRARHCQLQTLAQAQSDVCNLVQKYIESLTELRDIVQTHWPMSSAVQSKTTQIR